MQRFFRLLLDFGIGIGGRFLKFLRGPGQVAPINERGAQIEVRFAEIRAQAHRFPILCEGGVDPSSIFEKTTQYIVSLGQIRVVF